MWARAWDAAQVSKQGGASVLSAVGWSSAQPLYLNLKPAGWWLKTPLRGSRSWVVVIWYSTQWENWNAIILMNAMNVCFRKATENREVLQWNSDLTRSGASSGDTSPNDLISAWRIVVQGSLIVRTVHADPSVATLHAQYTETLQVWGLQSQLLAAGQAARANVAAEDFDLLQQAWCGEICTLLIQFVRNWFPWKNQGCGVALVTKKGSFQDHTNSSGLSVFCNEVSPPFWQTVVYSNWYFRFAPVWCFCNT